MPSSFTEQTAEVSVSLTGSWTWASVFCVHSEGDIDLSSYVALRHAQRAAICYRYKHKFLVLVLLIHLKKHTEQSNFCSLLWHMLRCLALVLFMRTVRLCDRIIAILNRCKCHSRLQTGYGSNVTSQKNFVRGKKPKYCQFVSSQWCCRRRHKMSFDALMHWLDQNLVMVQFGKVYIGRHKGWRNKFINAEVLFVSFLLKAAWFIWFIAYNLLVLNKQIIRRFGLKKLCWGRGLNRVRVTGEYKLAVSVNVTVSVMW